MALLDRSRVLTTAIYPTCRKHKMFAMAESDLLDPWSGKCWQDVFTGFLDNVSSDNGKICRIINSDFDATLVLGF